MPTRLGTSMSAAMSMRRPDHRMELEDVLADQVHRGRPEALGEILALARVRERRVVVEQRVDPDVDHLALVPRHRHSPFEPRAAEGEVPQTLPWMNDSASL